VGRSFFFNELTELCSSHSDLVGGEICAKLFASRSFFLDAKILTVHDGKGSVGVILGDDSLSCIRQDDERSAIA
jgi:hypothetical protein